MQVILPLYLPSPRLVWAMLQLVEPGTTAHLDPGKIYDSNRHTLLAALAQHHCEGVDLGIAEDT